jgi:RecA-family ATPase
VEGVMPSYAITSLYGEGGAGKSLLAMQLGASLATGKPFLGIDVKKHRVLGVFCEDDMDEIHRRIDDIRQGCGLKYQELHFFDVTSWVDINPILMEYNHGKGSISNTFKALEWVITNLKPDVLILDTAADLFGGNENVRTEVRQFLSGCLRQLATKYRLSILLLAHPSVAGISTKSGLAGSTAWNNSVRSRLYLERPDHEGGDSDVRVLSLMKSNYSATGAEIRMKYENGLFIKDGGTVKDSADKKKLAQSAFLEILDEMNIQKQNISPSRNAANYGPKTFARHPKAKGLKLYHFEQAMNTLLGTRAIRIDEYGKSSNPSKRLVRCGEESVGG